MEHRRRRRGHWEVGVLGVVASACLIGASTGVQATSVGTPIHLNSVTMESTATVAGQVGPSGSPDFTVVRIENSPPQIGSITHFNNIPKATSPLQQSGSQTSNRESMSQSSQVTVSHKVGQESAPSHPHWTFFGPIPENLNGVAFLIRWNYFVWPRSFQPSNFRNSHLWDRGYRFTTLMLSTHVVLKNPVTGAQIKVNHPIIINTSQWVRTVTLHPIGKNLRITCALKLSATHFIIASGSPATLDFSFSR